MPTQRRPSLDAAPTKRTDKNFRIGLLPPSPTPQRADHQQQA
jgi:hypothetical protein